MVDAVYGASTVKRDRWTQARLDVLDEAIIEVLLEEHPATVRSTFYRVESQGVVDKTEAGYRRVARRLLALRRDGAVPYSWVTDGTRYFLQVETWDDLDEAIAHWHAAYRRDLWAEQGVRVELFTEKDAISGVLRPVTSKWRVPFGVMRGYASESFAWNAAIGYVNDPRPVAVYQFGDHDPSGIGAWADFENKVRGFAPDKEITFERVAVTPAQIEEYELPTRPTKKSDTRSRGFVGGSVEVDAIPPSQLRALAEEAIERHVDEHSLAVTMAAEKSEREILASITGYDGA